MVGQRRGVFSKQMWVFFLIVYMSRGILLAKTFLEDKLYNVVFYEKLSMGSEACLLTQPVLSLTMGKTRLRAYCKLYQIIASNTDNIK